MRHTSILLIAALAALGGWFGQQAFSEDGPDAPAPGADADADAEDAMKGLIAPGPMHAWLARSAGEWDLVSEGLLPDGSLETTRGRATIGMILGGRWQEQVLHSTFHGQPYEGRSLLGYDNVSKAFHIYWFDTLGTAAAFAQGQLSEDETTLTLSGVWNMINNTTMPFTFTFHHESATCMVFTMTGEIDGTTMTLSTVRYTRR